MELKAGDRVMVESESTERPPRTGVIEEVVRGVPSPRYRISWDDGHESIYTPGGRRSAFRRAGREGVGPATAGPPARHPSHRARGDGSLAIRIPDGP